MRSPDWRHDGSMDQARRRAIIEALVRCDQNVAKAARRLRVGRSTLYRLISEFEVEVVHCTLDAHDRKQPAEAVSPGEDTLQSDAHHRSKLVQIGGQLIVS